MRSFNIFILVLLLFLPAYGQIDCYDPNRITVKGPDGDLVSNAKVWLFNVAADKTRKFVLEGKRKNGEDSYLVASAMGQFRGVDGRHWSVEDDYFIRILAPGFKTYDQEAEFRHCRPTDLEITLEPLKSSRSKGPQKTDGMVLKGVVVDSNHAAIKGVSVFAERNDGKVFQTITGEDGAYEISIEKGDYILRYSGGRGWADRIMLGYVRASYPKQVYPLNVILEINQQGTMVTELECNSPPDANGHMNCKMVSRLIKGDQATLSGKVFDHNRSHIPLVVVTAKGNDGKVYPAKTNWSGGYALDLPKGEYEITFLSESKSPFVYRNLKVDETSYGERNLDIILYPAGLAKIEPKPGINK